MDHVVVENISKSYNDGKTIALDQVSFAVKQGEVFGLIGPDGAGKTSLFRILTTLLLPDGGSASVAGMHVVKDYINIRNSIGYMPGRFSLYQDLTVEENLNFFATLFNTTLRENYELIREIYIQIEPFKNRRAGKLSGGMKQKLALCCALIHRPIVLFLDEPTTGVDVVSRKEFWDMLGRLKDQGITILVSTPYMEEAILCDRIALMQSGKILSIDTPGNIVAQYPKKLYAVKSKNMIRLLRDIRRNDNVESCFSFGEFLHVSLRNVNYENENRFRELLQEEGHEHVVVKNISPTIEDCFINLMNGMHVSTRN